MDQPGPKLDKASLAKVASLAKDKFIERGNCDGTLYLDHNEMVARAYAEATLALIHQQGFILVRKPVE